MISSTRLRVVLGAGSPDESMLELLEQALMDRIAKVGDLGIALHDNGRVIVWNLSLRFGVDSN